MVPNNSSPAGPSSAPPPGDDKNRTGSSKGLVSCAECRRSKLKCNRVFPCEACRRRGCAHLCPEGTLAATKGNKVLLTQVNTLKSQLQDANARNRQLSARIRELELLQPPYERDPDQPIPGPSTGSDLVHSAAMLEPVGELSDGVGSLSIGAEGQMKFHGETAGSEYLGELLPSQSNLSALALFTESDTPITREISELMSHFPLGMTRCPYGKEIFLQFLPSRHDSETLAGLYYRHASWMYCPLRDTQFKSQLMDLIYPEDSPTMPTLEGIPPHALSAFFTIIATGIYHTSQANVERTAMYHKLARAAFCMDPISSKSSCFTIQALMLMIQFSLNFDSVAYEPRWILMGLCVRLAQSVGLQTDSAVWNLDPEEQDMRRVLFWEVFTYDAWMGLVNGRPPALSIIHTNVRFPEDRDPFTNMAGQTEYGWHAWKFRYSAECLAPVIQHVFSSRIGYQALLSLDEKIRKFGIPSHLRAPCKGEDPSVVWSRDSYHAMTQFCLLCERESNLLYIHRSYFAYVLKDKPANPFQHRFAASVRYVYESAEKIISSLQDLQRVFPQQIQSVWFFWSGVFSSCVVLAGLVVESPWCSLAEEAHALLLNTINFFDAGSRLCRPPETMEKLRNLEQRANIAIESYKRGILSPEPSGPDELAVLRGQKNLITNQSPGSSPLSKSSSQLRPSSSSPKPSMPPSDHSRRSSLQKRPSFASDVVRANAGGYHPYAHSGPMVKKQSSFQMEKGVTKQSSFTRDAQPPSSSSYYPTSDIRTDRHTPPSAGESSSSMVKPQSVNPPPPPPPQLENAFYPVQTSPTSNSSIAHGNPQAGAFTSSQSQESFGTGFSTPPHSLPGSQSQGSFTSDTHSQPRPMIHSYRSAPDASGTYLPPPSFQQPSLTQMADPSYSAPIPSQGPVPMFDDMLYSHSQDAAVQQCGRTPYNFGSYEFPPSTFNTNDMMPSTHNQYWMNFVDSMDTGGHHQHGGGRAHSHGQPSHHQGVYQQHQPLPPPSQ